MPVPSVRAFARLMQQSVSVEPWISYDDTGEATYDTAVVYQCAVVGEMKVVRNAGGQEVPSSQQIYLMSNASLRPEDRLTLSTGDVGSTESFAINPKILAVGRFPFTRGQYVTTLDLE